MKAISPAIAVALLAGCAQPGGPAAQATAGPPGSDKPATTCTVAGTAVTGNGRATPTMTVSNDGFCGSGWSYSDRSAISMRVATNPQHGRVVTGEPGPRPTFRYYPNPGYEGTDSFIMQTGPAGRIYLSYTVTVTKA